MKFLSFANVIEKLVFTIQHTKLNWLMGVMVFLSTFSAHGQEVIHMDDTDFEGIITYSAEDSNLVDLENQQLHLFGNAHFTYTGMDMRADYILVDLKKKELLATFTLDSLNRRIGEPVFVDGTDTVKAGSIRYNFDTKKGYIQDVAIKQDVYYLSMGTAKRQENGEIHFIKGKFTTCNLEEPHYHFNLSKAVLVPDKRIVSGPLNLYVLGIPTPLGLPFAIIPQKKREDKNPAGFIMPQLSFVGQYGMGFHNLGYYIPINDRFQTTFFGTLYSRGSFGLSNSSEYAVRYKYRGNFKLGYEQYNYGWPSTTIPKVTTIEWTHTQDQKAHPYWNFNANILFKSNSNNKQSFEIQNQNYFNNTLNSDVRVSRKFAHAPLTSDLKLSMRQNSQSTNKTVDLTSPIVTMQTTSRIYPFKRINKIIGFSYANEFKNLSTFNDSLLNLQYIDTIASLFRTGAKQKFDLQGTFSLFKGKLKFSPAASYAQFYNFQSIAKSYDNTVNKIVVDTLNQGGLEHSFTSSGSISTSLYSYYRFIGKRQTLLRHVMTPTASLVYNPIIALGNTSYTDASGKEIAYNKFENSIYSQRITTSAARIDFGINNTFELKRKSEKDTLTGFKKTKIIDNLFLNTSYNVEDDIKWKDLTIRMVINPINGVNFTFNATHSWLAHDKIKGYSIQQYAYSNGQGIGRITQASLSSNLVWTKKNYREQLNQNMSEQRNTWNPSYQNWMVRPAEIVYFDIPWKISVDHIISYTVNSDSTTFINRKYVPNNTLTLAGDVSFTENWKASAKMYVDAKSGKISNINLNLYRNIHCWNVAFTWTPVGTNKSFFLTLRGNAAALQNANFTLRKPPIVL